MKGLRFAYKPPQVKIWNGSSVVPADSNDYTEDYKCLEEGSEVLVEAQLHFLISPNRHALRFSLVSVTALPIPPVLASTPSPTPIRRGVPARTARQQPASSIFDSFTI